MNRKSRMKSTLDSLFSSSKSQAQEPESPASPTPEPKPAEKPAAPVQPTAKKSAAKNTISIPAAKKSPPPVEAAKTPEAVVPDKKTEPQPSTPARPEMKAPEPSSVAENPAPVQIEEKTPAPAPKKTVPAQDTRPVGKPAEDASAAQNAPKNGGSEQARSDEEVHLVVFLLAGEAFGIGIQMVESIIKKQAITKVPHAEKFILGVTNLRGTVVPVVDLRQRFSMPHQEATKDTRIIVLNSESGKNGIVVDEVMEVMRVPKSAISPTPQITTTVNSSFIRGIARTDDRLIILLDVNSVLSQ